MNARSTTWPVQNATKSLTRLAAGTAVLEWSLWPWRSKAEVKKTEAGERYVITPK